MENIILNGIHNNAIAYTDYLENSSLGLINAFLNSKISEGSKIRFMPDVHSGKGCCIGTTMTINNIVIPSFVGVDIGCGVLAYEITKGKIELDKLDKYIHKSIPSGFNINNKPHRYTSTFNIDELKCFKNINHNKAIKSIGTLGGGNHFIEIDKSETTGRYWLVIHTGSRNLGVNVFSYYQDIAHKLHKDEDIPYEFSYFDKNTEEELFCNYLIDMQITQSYAGINRMAIADDIERAMKWAHGEVVCSIHNYIDTDDHILRKGAISANDNESMIIPLNMRDGALLCRGKGNSEWNYSAPHGSGRKISRSEAKESLTLTEYKKEMKGIYSSCISRNTIDESPMAYKDSQSIIDRIDETCTVIDRLIPIYNFKDGGK